jgi:hypothetical protein
VKKLFAILALGSFVIMGCEKPASSKPHSTTSVPPPAAKDAADKARAEGEKVAKEAGEKAKADAEAAAKKGAPDNKDKGK